MSGVRKRRSQAWLSPVWLIPLVAAVIASWMLYQRFADLGPTLTLELPSAEGIEAGKTLVKARDVEIGQVESLRLSEDLSRVYALVRLHQQAEAILRSDTQFWVVKPRIGRAGVSGLNTLLSGAYIQAEPGSSGQFNDQFVVNDHPPLISQRSEGVRIKLSSADAASVGVGDIVNFRGYAVGTVEEATFDAERRLAEYQLFVRAPYDQLITENIRFWLYSGLSLDVNSAGLSVQLGSIESLLTGGVTFDIPANQPPGKVVADGAEFRLFRDREEAEQEGFSLALEYVLLIDESIRGLNEGAPVEYRGVRVGTVAAAPFKFFPDDDAALPMKLIPVLIEFEPERLQGLAAPAAPDIWRARLRELFGDGMRASLKAGNLLTNTLYVDLAFYPEEAPYVAGQDLNGIEVMPSVSSGLAQLEQKVSRLLDNLNDVDFGALGSQFEQSLVATQALVGELNQSNQALRSWLSSDAVQDLPTQLQQTLQQLQQTLDGYDANAAPYELLEDNLQQLNNILRDLAPLTETLNEQPNAIFFDRRMQADPTPSAAGGKS